MTVLQFGGPAELAENGETVRTLCDNFDFQRLRWTDLAFSSGTGGPSISAPSRFLYTGVTAVCFAAFLCSGRRRHCKDK